MTGESLRLGWTIIARAFRNMYDYMGLTMLLSSVWFLVGLVPPAFAAYLVYLFSSATGMPHLGAYMLFGLVSVGLFGPVTAATYAVTDAVIRREEVGLRDFFRFLREHYLRGASLTAALEFILAVLIVDIVFFASLPHAWAGYLVFLWLYFVVFFAFMASYAYPLAVRRKAGLFQTLKAAFLLAADNLVVSLLVALTALAFGAASLFLQAPFLLFFGGTIAFLHCVALDEVMKKYAAMRQQKGEAETSDEREVEEESSNV